MQKLQMNRWFGTKTFYKQVLFIAAPLMLQQLIMSSVNLVDNLMVGQLGDAAIGGVGVANRFYMIANFGALGIVQAASIFIAQFFGAKDYKHLRESFGFAIIGAYVVLIPFTLVAIAFPQVIVGFFTKDPAYIAQGVAYLRIVGYSFLPLGITVPISSALRSIGETKLPLYANATSVATNAFFNYILIFGHLGAPSLNVAGAAIATVIARVVESMLLIIFVLRGNYPFKGKLSEILHVSKKLSAQISLKAYPLVVNEVLWSTGMAMLLKLYAERGADVITAYAVTGTTSDLFFSLFGGMAGATTIIIGQKLGANELEEARANGYQLLTFGIILAILFGFGIFACSFIVPPLYDLSPTTHQMAANLTRIVAVMFWIYMINAECYFILRAGGDTFSTMVMDSWFMWFVNIPVVAAVAYLTDVNIYFLYICGQSTDLLKMAVAFTFVRKEKWVKNLTKFINE